MTTETGVPDLKLGDLLSFNQHLVTRAQITLVIAGLSWTAVNGFRLLLPGDYPWEVRALLLIALVVMVFVAFIAISVVPLSENGEKLLLQRFKDRDQRGDKDRVSAELRDEMVLSFATKSNSLNLATSLMMASYVALFCAATLPTYAKTPMMSVAMFVIGVVMTIVAAAVFIRLFKVKAR
jgi:hypothetical protein